MREAPKAPDHILMAQRVVKYAIGFRKRRQRLDEAAREQLVLERFAMLEREIEKQSFHWQTAAIVPGGESAARGFARKAICSESARRVAEHVARKLVKQESQRKALGGMILPVTHRPGCGQFVGREKIPAYLRIECGILAEPLYAPASVFGPVAKPELQDFPGGTIMCFEHGKIFRLAVNRRKCDAFTVG